jgi:3-oxoadipate enol-lactonase
MMTTVDVHHVVSGPAHAPVVLMSNSLGSDLRMWDAQAAALARDHRVVRYDMRGHGRSPAPPGPYSLADLAADALALLDRLEVARAHLVGLSLGGMVAMQLAATAPDRVDRMVLCCTSAHMPPASNWYDRAATVRTDGIGAVAGAVVDRWLTPGFAGAAPGLVRDLRAMVEATPDEGYAGCCEAIGAMDLRPLLARIVARTLLIAGADDPATPVTHAMEIAAAVAAAEVVTVGPAAHMANVEQPTAVTQHIMAHLTNGDVR